MWSRGLNRDAAWIPSETVFLWLGMALTGVYGIFRFAKANHYQQVAAPREGLWTE